MRSSTERIVIVGGGLLGCLSALFAARVRKPDGSPAYQVTLLEKEPRILDGAAIIAARDHRTGLEYPKDAKTGKACTESSFITNLVWNGLGIHTKEPPILFGYPKEMNDLRYISINYPPYAEAMAQHYDAMNERLTAAGRFTLPPARGQALDAPNIAAINQSRYFTELTGVVQSQERGFDIPRRLSLLEEALKKSGVRVVTGFDVTRIKKAGNIFRVTNGKGEYFSADQVLNAAWDGGLRIRPISRPAPATSEMRTMALLDITHVPRDMPSIFIMDTAGIGTGGMFARINQRSALLYVPSKLAAYKKDVTPAQYLAQSKETFPQLSDSAKVLVLIKRPTLLQTPTLEERRYALPEELVPGFWRGFPLKGIYAERMAIEIVEGFKARSCAKAQGHADAVLPSPDVLDCALNDPLYRLPHALESVALDAASCAAREKAFLEQRNLPLAMLNDQSHARCAASWTHRTTKQAGGHQR